MKVCSIFPLQSFRFQSVLHKLASYLKTKIKNKNQKHHTYDSSIPVCVYTFSFFYKPGTCNEQVSITCLVIFHLILYHGSILRSLILKPCFHYHFAILEKHTFTIPLLHIACPSLPVFCYYYKLYR